MNSPERINGELNVSWNIQFCWGYLQWWTDNTKMDTKRISYGNVDRQELI